LWGVAALQIFYVESRWVSKLAGHKTPVAHIQDNWKRIVQVHTAPKQDEMAPMTPDLFIQVISAGSSIRLEGLKWFDIWPESHIFGRTAEFERGA
jgi:hypothetical protein